jgi:non-ribosomal peptide synthase protein (TIGR01720 family)
LEINCYVIDKKLNVILKYCQDEFQEENINSFINTFRDYIEMIIIYCCRKKTVDFTSSDFDTIELSQDELDSIFA